MTDMRRITLDDVAKATRPGSTIPGRASFSPDGRMLTYLFGQPDSLTRVLWALDLEGGEPRVLFDPAVGVTEENISREEALRRERQRLMHTGVTHYEWAEDAPVILVPLRGELWVLRDADARKVGEGALDARISPDGARIAFVREGELHSLEVSTQAERRLTFDAQPGVTNGLAEFVAQEEMGRLRGFWWSADSEWLAYEQADERHIPVFRIPHWGTDALDEEEHRYPFAGAENVRARLGVVSARGGDTVWMDLGAFEYLVRVAWHPDGRLFAQTMDRSQRRLELRACDPKTGESQVLLVEEQEPWVNLHDDLRFERSTGEFTWSSERSGLRQLELRASDGSLVRELTRAPYPVDAVIALDQQGRRLAFAAGRTPVETQVFIVPLDGGEPQQITAGSGQHGVVFSKDLSSWVQVSHSLRAAPSVVVHGRAERVLHAPEDIELELSPPELFTFTTPDGETLHGALWRPARLPAPLIVSVYGGPHAQMVVDSWGLTVALRAQHLAQQGFAVMCVDNRGSARRGLAFEGALARRMGTVEIEDQVAGVRFAQQQGWVDGDRVGMYGWSYGGYMTIMCMLKAPEVFRVGVAGAPVTHWDGYDTFYTERYMGTPQENPEGYRDGSAMEHAAELAGKLMIIHGMIDENVHFRHTARFLDALQKANRPVDLMVYPEERHSPRSEADRRSMEERVVRYFQDNL